MHLDEFKKQKEVSDFLDIMRKREKMAVMKT
jgi:hypothetical protein